MTSRKSCLAALLQTAVKGTRVQQRLVFLRTWPPSNRSRRPLKFIQHSEQPARCFSCAAQEHGPFQFTTSEDDLRALKGKARLDAFLVQQQPEVSRAKIQEAIKAGRVTVNSQAQLKTSTVVKAGDAVCLTLPRPAQLRADPEDLPLDIVFEDDWLLVVNKAAGMVVHPSPGHESGTLVNALLHHCSLPPIELTEDMQAPTSLLGLGSAYTDEEEEEDFGVEGAPKGSCSSPVDKGQLTARTEAGSDRSSVIRPGIVHRIDKGTSGLLVIAKDARTHNHLCQQFKTHTVRRVYQSIVLGCPRESEGSIQTGIGRDPRDRKRMAVYPLSSNRARRAASHYKVLETLTGGTAALVEWRLQTGRTHQIRVHAKHLGHPLFGDETYSGGGANCVKRIGLGKNLRQAAVWGLVKALERPALHALTLGFEHPSTGKQVDFEAAIAADFQDCLQGLRTMTASE
ncbi:hypothetical protein WJX74_007332 [Apatococcus lobatus]|uniref:RNA-binding S4 domain-containing protein n=1 Tax=Apatococcus lobatus TaxID=904363 RepID=A0AAW1QJS7_9CHLO